MEITTTLYVHTRPAWRAWLQKHHARKSEIWLVYYKAASGKPRIPYGEAVEEALCFGWIDSIVKTLDEHRFAQRFTPRQPGSNWSTPNLDRVKRLIAAGQMTPAGGVHIPGARAAKAFHVKHRRRTTTTTVALKDLAAAIARSAKAAIFWKTLAPGYRRLYVRVVIECKRPETRAKRVITMVDRLSRGAKHPMGPVAGYPRT
ncbi:MAG: hypothetical protein FJ202_06205 [Gemmatimonadetes bacterium]|nr:hypothetical protein [Gemmatimonadota bacterium]